MSTPRTPLSEPGRRPHDATSGARRGERHGRSDDDEVKRLIVGPGISLSGEITACDVLVIEGSVQANLSRCVAIEIAESGTFKQGEADIERADISGIYDGTLTVRNRLTVRSTGRVVGTIRYGEIEIEAGGIISGDVQMMVPEMPKAVADSQPARPVASAAPAAAPTTTSPSGPSTGSGDASSGTAGSAAPGGLSGRPPEKAGDLVGTTAKS